MTNDASNHAQIIEFQVETSGERLDKLIVERAEALSLDLSRARIQAMIKDGHVTVNGTPVKPGVKLRGAELVRAVVPSVPEAETQPEKIDLTVIYEDDEIAVIDKPAGMVVHPGTGNEAGTLVNALLARYPKLADMRNTDGRQGIVHRLDKDTSGLMVIALTDHARLNIINQFQERTVQKIYLALLERTPKTVTGRIDAAIGRDPRQRKRMAVQRDGRPAVTEFVVTDTDFREDQALVEVNLLTGRTHQIRVHMAFIGCPVVGDAIYGFRKQRVGLKRNFLHAHKLAFDHPRSGERLNFESPLPVGLQNILSKLRS